ncbi:MAG: ABC transporter ATP-binding protein/permease [Lachnospiraceae bacterium]|nr:ABC transporter ATP-binding protein/permease [Lachnospiraceae bacterium]
MALLSAVADVACGMIGLLVYISVLSSLHWALALVVTVSYLVTYFLNIRAAGKQRYYRDLLAPMQRRIAYIVSKAGAAACAKDMRIFRMSGWLFEKYDRFAAQKDSVLRESETAACQNRRMNAIVHFLRDTATYLCLVYLYMRYEMTVADFVFYVSLTASFSGMLSRIAEGMQQAHKCSLDVAELTDFLCLSKEADRRKEKRPLPQEAETIEFLNVSYHYPGSGHLIIDHLNLKLSRAEKTGIVGLNGAGKTTLALLLSGLLTPTGGRILLNGIDITEFDPQEYIAMFSAVFQEISVLPMTIAENIALGEADSERLKKSVEDAGLTGLDLQKRFIQEIYPDAVSLSGGEMQKLALARAIYKPSKCLILDEPTAALDPIAEQNLYRHYNQFSDGKISLFISHRLASTLFCDRIILLENGKIAESGSHKELMERGGKYRELFETQRRNYQREELREVCL